MARFNEKIPRILGIFSLNLAILTLLTSFANNKIMFAKLRKRRKKLEQKWSTSWSKSWSKSWSGRKWSSKMQKSRFKTVNFRRKKGTFWSKGGVNPWSQNGVNGWSQPKVEIGNEQKPS
jgi:hypothetical protein